jgi:hypothetical protein
MTPVSLNACPWTPTPILDSPSTPTLEGSLNGLEPTLPRTPMPLPDEPRTPAFESDSPDTPLPDLDVPRTPS